MTWDELNFWQTGEWQAVDERLSDLDAAGIKYNPARENLFAALDLVPFDKVRVVLVGQDPYPDPRFATGIAFSIPKGQPLFPLTLRTIFDEYVSDLSYPMPTNGDLTPWANQGVLLWNAIPTCLVAKSLSHEGWPEWPFLTQEIVEKLSEKSVVFAFIGRIARNNVKYVHGNSEYIEVAHPSPKANLKSKNPFKGSRLFSTINDHLNAQGLGVVDWRL